MTAVVFVHGLLSSPKSNNAKIIRDWLNAERPDWKFYCPALTPYPKEAITRLTKLIEKLLPQEIYLIGSSMGGFWSTYLTEQYNLIKTALLNPVTDPVKLLPQYLGQELENIHTGEKYQYEESHIPQMRNLEIQSLKNPDNYLLLVNSGDEVLDYRDAVEKYKGCKQVVLQGGKHGDHIFQSLEIWIPEIITFFECSTTFEAPV